MDDMISRQAAISAIKEWGLLDGLSEGQAIEILADEEKVPSAQPEHLVKESGNLVKGLVNDCIRRQAAIDALRNRWLKTKNYEGIGEDIAEECEIYLRTVPSAQPEIIRCKDCKYWMRAYLSISGKHGCNVMRDYTAPDDYCFKAERKA